MNVASLPLLPYVPLLKRPPYWKEYSLQQINFVQFPSALHGAYFAHLFLCQSLVDFSRFEK